VALRNIRTGGVLGIETKFFDASVTGTAIVSGTDASGAECDPATILCLNAPAQGDGPSSRDGQKISMKSIFVTGVLSSATQTSVSSLDALPIYYIALVLDTQTNGGTATGLNSEEVFVNNAAAGVLAANPLRNMSNTQRFKVLKQLVLRNPTTLAGNDAGTTMVAEQVPDIVWALVVLFGAIIGIVVVKAVLNSATRKIGGAVGGGGKRRGR